MRNLVTVILAFAVGLPSAYGETLKGRVTDADGLGLPAVSVVTDLPGVGTMTDEQGYWELELRPGPAGEAVTRLTFSSVGYETRQFRLAAVPEVVALKERYYRGTDILVRAERAEGGLSPVAFTNVSRAQIARDYAVGEFPLLLETTPNFFAYSDGGAPLGYSYTNIRGFDDKRITTYINGVPLNDPEDQATYFVDLPDFAATIDDIQVQRGVGNSLYGDASFGGTINVATSALARPRSARLTFGYGEFSHNGELFSDISKQSVEYSSGLIDGRWHFSGRYSKQKTDGYRRNSWYDGWAYALSAARLDANMTTELYLYGGPMRMHLAYWGASREAITADRIGNVLTYPNETDNFNQPHYHLHHTWRLGERTTLANTLYYIRGKGYYEQYKDESSFYEYNIAPSMVEIDTSTGEPYAEGDLVRQQWVSKNQWGWNPTLTLETERTVFSLGGSFYFFESNHWGQVVWAQHIAGKLPPNHKFYRYFGKSRVASVFAQAHHRLTDRLSAQVTAQVRYKDYDFDQVPMGAFLGYDYALDWLFFSPRLGITYRVDERIDLFANFAVSSRPPTDASIYDANDPNILPSLEITSVNADSTRYTFGDPLMDNERVYDFELGGSYQAEKYGFEVNLFWMDFRNEIIPNGGLNVNTGLPITINAERSVHAGVELAAAARVIEGLTLDGNLAANYGRVKEFAAVLDGYTVDYGDKKLVNFPDYLGNFIVDYERGAWRITSRTRLVGKRYMELYNVDKLALDPYVVTSLSLRYTAEDLLGLGSLSLSLGVDNLGDKKYETSGYGGDYAYVDGGEVVVDGWAEYFVAAERSFFGQVQLEMF